MKIVLLASPQFTEIGGVSTHVFMLARGLNESGHSVLVIRDYTPRWFRWPFVRLPEVLLGKLSIYFSHRYQRKVEDLYFLLEVLYKTRGRLDVLNIQNVQYTGVAKLLRRLTGCKLVLTVHGYLTYEAETRKWCTVGDKSHKWLWQLETKGYNHFDVIVCVGSRAGSYVRQFTNKPVTIIPNGLDTELFRPAVGQSKNSVNIMFAGLLQPAKGIMDALKALYILVKDYKIKVKLHVAGKGVQEEEARQFVFAQDLKDNVVFLGALPKEKMPDFYCRGDILLFPSCQAGLSGRSEESSPYAVLEAMASGLPVVAYRTSALEEHVQEGITGYLSTPGDIRVLADNLRNLCLDAELLQMMGKKAREYCELNYAQKMMTQRYLDVYRGNRQR